VIFHEAIPVAKRIARPIRMQSVEVSPQEPGYSPRKMSEKLSDEPVTQSTSACQLAEASCTRGVAPEYPSIEDISPSDTNTLSPLICEG